MKKSSLLKSVSLSAMFISLMFMHFSCNLSDSNKKVKSKIERAPNILLITVDDLGWADLGCYGADLHETPHIDAFAATGQKFTNAYAAAAICTPTRAALLTGKSPAKLNMTIWREAAINDQFENKLIPPDVSPNLPLKEVTIAEALKAEGYMTAHLGKWHVGDGEHFPETQGFDINVGATVWGAPPTFFFPYRGEIYNSMRFVPGLERDVSGGYNFDRAGEYLTDRLTDEAISIMERFKEEPFFINLSYYTVHTPTEGKKDIVDYYQKKLASGMSHQNAIYAAMVHSLDENIGKLMHSLEDLNLADNTVVIFTSDNGGFINEWDGQTVTDNAPLRSGKGALYEGGIRVPTIIRWPDVTIPNTTSEFPITTQDFYPTLLEMANLKGNPEQVAAFDGISLIPILKNPQTKMKQREMYWHYPHYYHTTTPVSAIRRGDWKLLEFFEDNQVELYNLKQDASENNNLEKENPEKTRELLKLLTSWRQYVNAPMPQLNPEYPK